MADLLGTDGAETLTGGAGDDALNGLNGPDVLIGGDGRDALLGGGGADVAVGGAGDDVIYGYDTADALAEPGFIRVSRTASGLTTPVFATAPVVDENRLYVVEQTTGRIKIVDLATGQTLATPFLDIPDAQLSTGGERGLLGLAFHPDHAANGLFYVNLTNAAGDTEVREYRRSAANRDLAEPTGRVILTIDQPDFTNHKGGWLGFGPDGLLYIASGDGGGAGDPFGNAQNPNSLLGKILRIDVNRDDFPADPLRNYGVPADNPFAGGRPGADEIWVMGLRNPWRPSFDRLTGDLYIADVGQGAREEVNVVRAGADSTPGNALNFGWDFREGRLPFEGTAPAGLIDPVLDYAHGPTTGRSITGGYVQRGPGGAQGVYFFADFVSGALFSAQVVNGVAVDFINRGSQLRSETGAPLALGNVASFGQDARGNLYVVEYGGDILWLTPGASAADGADLLFGQDGNDQVFGGAGADTLYGGAGDDQLDGGIGDDLLNGEAGADTLLGRDGADLLSGEIGDDRLFGGAGSDQLLGGAGRDTLNGEADADLLFGAAEDDVLSGEAGDDVLNGEAGADLLLGGAGVDILSGELGDDSLYGGEGADQLLGGAGADLLNGETGSDYMDGGDGADTLSGEAGDDLLIGGAGADVLIGGAGSDRFAFRAAGDSTLTARDLIVDFTAGVDRIDLSAVDANSGAAGDQAFVFVEVTIGGPGVATLIYEAASNRTLFSGYIDADEIPDIQFWISGRVTPTDGFVL